MSLNYDLELKKVINNLDNTATLLLHTCCGPCSTYVVEYLKPHFDLTVLFYNPNIEPLKEYIKRK
jgi:predicted adenine nucleotide alpha hydrolase (AANH) superfamily ATPase